MAKTKIHYPQWKTQSSPARRSTDRATLVDVIALTAEACGHPMSMAAAEMLADDLAGFDEQSLLGALARCRLELDGPLRAPEVLARIDDGRPDADLAWAMMPSGEHDSVVWTEEMAQAWGSVQLLLDGDDPGAAQAAFSAAYDKRVIAARLRGEPARWTPSLGRDVAGRELALRDAVSKGRMTAAQAEMLLGYAIGVPEPAETYAQEEVKNLH
ncbi:hypothetical protein E4K72_11010 [Oxalobacteraceae bacterium OM1]|nr:hypothetical protein E4K72_11010 [Oxalobacteraceae bacterium OM1]